MNLWLLFCGTILTSFGFGVKITQFVGEGMVSGIWYLGIGYILLIAGAINYK